MSEQKTPRTDSATITNLGKILERKENASYVPVEFARTLERSNAELLAALKALIGNEANADIQRAKAELFRLAPDIQSAAFSAIAKAKGEA